MVGKDYVNINVKPKDKFHVDYKLTKSEKCFAFFVLVASVFIVVGGSFIVATN